MRIYPSAVVFSDLPSLRRLRRAVLCLVVAVSATVPAPGTPAQTTNECLAPQGGTPEIFGPTDISATTGNQRLSVAVNPDATVTVLKWPSPSFYDQIKYRTRDRSAPHFGAFPNEGAFLGLGWKRPSKSWKFQWLRRWPSRQRFAHDDTDEVVTTFTKRAIGLTAVVRDVVAPGTDALVRRVVVRRAPRSKIRVVRVFSFANFNPVYSKRAQSPVQDWCFEEQNDEGGTYVRRADAVVHARSGVDGSTGRPSSVATAMAIGRHSDQHEVGIDTYEDPGSGTSAYDDSDDARLSGSDSAPGQADAAVADHLALGSDGRAATTVVLAAGRTTPRALRALGRVRSTPYGKVAGAKRKWWRAWLRGAPLPQGAPAPVERLAKRTLISLRQAIDKGTPEHDPEGADLQPGATIVASIATQSPYGEDWIRGGAYVNRVLDVIGKHDLVARHNLRYAVLQHRAGDAPRGGQPIAPGNWAMNFYADGVVGGPIPYEIDETGYGIWTLWDHYAQTRDRDYLLNDHGGIVYLAIQRAAQYLTDVCRDARNGLQCVANEGDNPNPSQTLLGAMLVWLGLDSATRAARTRATDESLLNADRWETRRDEIGAAIEQEFFDQECSCYTTDYEDGGTLLWPIGYLAYGTRKSDAQATANWKAIRPSVRGRGTLGGYEAKALLGNAYAWGGQKRQLTLVKRGLRWVATVPVTNETGLLGEAWMRYPRDKSPVVTMVSQPHVWQQALFYLAALRAYGRAPWRF